MRRATRTSAGFTIVELLLAAGLFSILMAALLQLVSTSMTIWERTDTGRELSEMGGAAMDLLARDVHALEGSSRGDLLADWRLHDLDRDGIDGAPFQRLRLVRHMGAAGLQRLARGTPGLEFETFERALVEVGWALLPYQGDDPDQRAHGVLVRGERLKGDEDTLSFFAEGFFGPSGGPVPGSLYEVTGGVLWFEVMFASQTSILHDGWELGDGLAECSASWDAWNRGRPDTERSVLNSPAGGMPQAKDVPLLPRRVRIALELERPKELRFRTRLAVAVTPEANDLTVEDGRKIPADAMLLIGDEWMQVLAVNGDRVAVQRGRRATRKQAHAEGAMVHHGWRIVREIPVSMTREDWDL